MKQYILNRKIDLDLDILGLTSVCYYLLEYYYNGKTLIISTVFYDLVHDYFCGLDQNEESKIVRLVQNTIMDIKKGESFYDGPPGDLLFDVTRELVDLAKENKALTPGALLDPYREQIENYWFPTLSEDDRLRVYARIDKLIVGLCYEKTNRLWMVTPEEAVAKYIL